MTTIHHHAEEEFEAFWAAYPKRPGNPKHAARKQWLALCKTGTLPPLNLVLSAVKAYRSHCAATKTDVLFVAHARTWLSQRRWEDWLPQQSAAPQLAPVQDWTHAYPMWAALKSKMDPMRWTHWFANAHPNGSETTLIVPTRFERDEILKRFEDLLDGHFNRPVTVICRADVEAAKEKAPGSLERPPSAASTCVAD